MRLCDVCDSSSLCKFNVTQLQGTSCCPNNSCQSHQQGGGAGGGRSGLITELHYDLPVSLSDHTGSLDGVRLKGQAASDLLKKTVRTTIPMCVCVFVADDKTPLLRVSKPEGIRKQ